MVSMIMTVILFFLFREGPPRAHKFYQGYSKSIAIDTNAILRSIDSELVLVPGGTFRMGSDDPGMDFGPAHEVWLDSFMIGRYTISIKQFEYFILATGYRTSADSAGGSFVIQQEDSFVFRPGVNWRYDEHGSMRNAINDSYPVIHVSQMDATAYCSWLNAISGYKYRLPTEAEWEYAAGGGPSGRPFCYSGGNNLNEISWYGKNSGLVVHPRGQKRCNGLGLYDMTGNVWQACSDWYSADYYLTSPLHNPQGPQTGSQKVFRGGSFLSGFRRQLVNQCDISFRGKEDKDVPVNDISFRIVRNL